MMTNLINYDDDEFN